MGGRSQVNRLHSPGIPAYADESVRPKLVVVTVAGIIAAAMACSSFEDSPATEGDGGPSDGSAQSPDGSPIEDAAITDAGLEASRGEVYRQAVLGEGPTAYWRMGRIESSTLVPDESVNAAPLVLSSAQTGVPGIFDDDPAIQFGGVGFAEATRSDLLEFNGVVAFTLEYWARHDGPLDGGSYFEHLLAFAEGPAGEDSQDGYFIYLRNDVPPKMTGWRDSPEAPAQQAESTFPNDHAWHHHVMTYDGLSISMFLDGQPTAKADTNAAISARPGKKFTVARASNETTRYFRGAMDEIAVYPKALDVVTIAKHHDLGRQK
jgi:large repetitive protein